MAITNGLIWLQAIAASACRFDRHCSDARIECFLAYVHRQPGFTHDDIIACLAYARDLLSSEKVFPSAA
jgi:hypothetical protein